MSTRGLGMATMAVGAVLSVVGVIGLLSGDTTDPPTAGESASTTAVPTPSTTTTASTTTTGSTTTTAPTTTQAPSTTGASTTTTTVPNPDEVASFVDQFTAWIGASDADSLTERLHPAVIDTYGEDLCRSFVEREILALEDYRATGSVVGPDPSQFGSVAIDVYRVAVAFTFQGEDFTSDAAFAFHDGVVHWFATCR